MFAKRKKSMKTRFIVKSIVVLVGMQAVQVQAKVWNPFKKSTWKDLGDDINKTVIKPIGKTAEQIARETKAAAEKLGREVEKAGGVIAQTGVKVGNVTIKEISKAGDVTINVAGKVGGVVLKTGESVVTTTGMTLLNIGGLIVALTSGDINNIRSCAMATYYGARYSASSVVNEALKVAGNLDKLVQIESVSLEASSAELTFQGRTPKVSIKGSFLGKKFNIKNLQVDLSKPNKIVEQIFSRIA